MPNHRQKKPPPPNSPQRLCLRKKENSPVLIPLFVFFPKTVQWTARCTVPSQITLVICFSWAQVDGLAHPGSGRELVGGGDGNERRGRVGTRGRGAGRASELDWVSVDFTLQRTRQPPLLSSHDYIPVRRFRKEAGLAWNSQGLEMWSPKSLVGEWETEG